MDSTLTQVMTDMARLMQQVNSLQAEVNRLKRFDVPGIDVTGFVPYSGATSNVALGIHSISAVNLIIATSGSPGFSPALVAPAVNILNVLGIANGETSPSAKGIFDATNPAAIGTAAPGTSLIAAHRDHVHAMPSYVTLDVANSRVGIGTASPNAELDLFSSVQASDRIRFSGQEYYLAGHTDTDGVAIRLGVNRAGNRQLWFADSAAAINATNALFRIQLTGTTAAIVSVSTDGTTLLPMSLNASNVTIPPLVADYNLTLGPGTYTGGTWYDLSGTVAAPSAGSYSYYLHVNDNYDTTGFHMWAGAGTLTVIYWVANSPGNGVSFNLTCHNEGGNQAVSICQKAATATNTPTLQLSFGNTHTISAGGLLTVLCKRMM